MVKTGSSRSVELQKPPRASTSNKSDSFSSQLQYLTCYMPATDIFLTPHKHVGKRQVNGKYKHASINRLASIQRKPTILITGALKSTAINVAKVLANIFPFYLLVDKHHHNTATQLATLPSSHPLYKPVINAAANLVKKHPISLYDLMYRFNIHSKSMERIQAIRFEVKHHHDYPRQSRQGHGR